MSRDRAFPRAYKPMRQLHGFPSKKANTQYLLLIEEIYDRHDINGGRQTRIRIRDKKHPLKSDSGGRDEN